MDQIDRALVQEASEAGILDISWVMDRIAVGGWIETEEKMRAVVEAGITHVIDMAWEFDDTPLEQFGIKVLLNFTDDDFQIKPPELLHKGVEFALEALQQPGSKLLIHCVAGRHRGPMMTLAVLGALGWSLEDAMQIIADRRPVVDWAPVYVESVANFLSSYLPHLSDSDRNNMSARFSQLNEQTGTGPS
jgi:hypothetical protein